MTSERFSSRRLFAALALSASGVLTLHAQSNHPVSVQAEYTWVHTNLLPGCNCFGMQGGSGEVEFGLAKQLSVVADGAITHRGGLTPSGYALTESAFTGGLRYAPRGRRIHINPFGEVFIGAAHASGTLSPLKEGYGGDTAFAFQTGGGIRIQLGRRFALVPIHLDYLLTTFGNGADDRQNQLRLSGGLRFNFR